MSPPSDHYVVDIANVDNSYDYDNTLTALDEATKRLLATVDGLSDDDVSKPSLLPGWSKGHVLAHIARNADGLRNLVTWARTGVETPAYASRESRDADIECDAPRTIAEHRNDLAETARDLSEDVQALPEDRLDAVTVRTQPGREFPARGIAWRRLREVEIHHVDLEAGYGPDSWPEAFVTRCTGDIIDMFAQHPDTTAMTLRAADSGREWQLGSEPGFRVVSGEGRFLLAWLLGRTAGTELTVTPSGPLPQPPAWT